MVGKSRRMLAGVTMVMLAALLLPLMSFAGSTGKIEGQLDDKKTGEPIIGANVLVVGTKLGAATDLDGRFIIPRVDPGTYVLRISHLEYNTVEVSGVEVKIDQTFSTNQQLEQKVTELDKVVRVTGKRDVLEVSQVQGEVYISQEAIKNMPVTTVDALLEGVAGVQTTASGEVFVRGGRAGEVSYIVDGVPIDDPLGGSGQVGANLSLVSGSIQEIQIIKDGFDPEYGNALSGIVNIRSRVGSKDNTRLNFQYLTDDLGNRSLNKYSRNFDYLRMSISGPDPLLTTKLLPSLGINFLKDQEFTYYLYADADKNDGVYKMQDFNTPNTVREFPAFNFLGIDIPERLQNRYTFQGNFKFRPRQNLKFVASYKKWHTRQTIFNWAYRYANATAPVAQNDRESISLEVTQAVSKDMNYELIMSVVTAESRRAPGDPNHPGRALEPDEFYLEHEWETYEDVNDNGRYDAPEPLINLFPDTMSYGSFSGPEYTLGEYLVHDNVQGGGEGIFANFRFNSNGILDSLEGEPFIDLNGNGVWDKGDILNDKNGNGILDSDRIPTVGTPEKEPFIDGDSILGEPFTDLNANGSYDVGIDAFVQSSDETINQDLNHNGRYDGPDRAWTLGVPYLDRNANGIYDRPNGQYDPGEVFTDANGNGIYDAGGASTFLDPGTHDATSQWKNTRVRTWRGEIKAIRQMGRHEVKAGFSMQSEEILYQEIKRPYFLYTGRPDTTNPYSERGELRDFYEYNPTRGTVYLRDKIEYGSMIASLGLRWDFFLQDTEELARTFEADDRGGLIQGDRQKFSPRIGFSYPISDKAKVYFNYGHFFQLPGYVRFYARNTSSTSTDDVLGNPNLDYQKTIQYSFGVKYKMTESYTVDFQGYFKDEFDKINQTVVLEGQQLINRFRNSDYGRSRGFEITLEKYGGGYVNGTASYAYAFAFGKASKTQDQFERFLNSREPLTESPLNNDIRHTLKAGIQVYIPNTVKPRLFGVPILNGWSLSLQSIIQSGKPFTPAKSYPNISSGTLADIETNSLRFPSTAVFDIRFSKELKVANLDWQMIFWVENVFDTKNVETIYSSTGRPDTQDQTVNNVVREGSPFDVNPYNWDYGRQIRLGLELSI